MSFPIVDVIVAALMWKYLIIIKLCQCCLCTIKKILHHLHVWFPVMFWNLIPAIAESITCSPMLFMRGHTGSVHICHSLREDLSVVLPSGCLSTDDRPHGTINISAKYPTTGSGTGARMIEIRTVISSASVWVMR